MTTNQDEEHNQDEKHNAGSEFKPANDKEQKQLMIIPVTSSTTLGVASTINNITAGIMYTIYGVMGIGTYIASKTIDAIIYPFKSTEKKDKERHELSDDENDEPKLLTNLDITKLIEEYEQITNEQIIDAQKNGD